MEAIAPGQLGLVSLGHAVAYPFGVIGVVLFVQLMPRILKVDIAAERAEREARAAEANAPGDEEENT